MVVSLRDWDVGDAGKNDLHAAIAEGGRALRLTLRDFTVTALLTVLLGLYCAYIALEGLPLLWGVPEMASTGLVLGAVSWCLVAREQFVRHPVACAITFGSVVLGTMALATKSEPVLTAFMASIGMLWLRGLYLRSDLSRPLHQLHASH